MQSSTVKRERLIPPIYLLSIALLLTVAFIVLLPSREIFTLSPQYDIESSQASINDLEVAYIRASNASGTLPANELSDVVRALVRGQRWQDARSLLADRPDVKVSDSDAFLLRLESSRQGYLADRSEADKSSFAAELTMMLTNFLDKDALHDRGTLLRAAEVSIELEQPELAASYRLMLATADPENAVRHFQSCALVLAQYNLTGQAESCYRTAIANTTDPMQNLELSLSLIYLLNNTGDLLTANQELEHLVQVAPQKTEVLTRLASLSLSLERPDLAYPLYGQLSIADSSRAVHWLEKAAQWSQASNLPGLSAEYLETIIQLSDEQHHPELIKRRQSLLIAAGRNEEALQTVHARLNAEPAHAELLKEGIMLAANLGLNAQAMEWNEQLLQIRPYDVDSMRKQIDYTLATRQPGSALKWGRKLLEIEPGDKNVRLRIAQLEEWNGNLQNAQQHRVWLASVYPSDTNDLELIRISELNWDSATAAKTLQRLGTRTALSRENVIKLVRLHEANGRPDRAASALRAMQRGNSNHPMLYRELAALHKRHRKWNESLAAWQTFADKFGRSSEESANRMELHWRLKQPEQALEMAENVAVEYLASASPYQLELMTELGWRYREPDLVLAAAPYLKRTDLHEGKRVLLARRITQSHLDNNDPQAAIAHAEKEWQISGDKDFILTALKVALDEDIYPHKERYLDANGELIVLRELPEYWLTVADHYVRQSDSVAALETYESTLMLQPDNIDAMTGILWTLMSISPADNKRLADAIDKYEPIAVDQPELWSPLAVGRMQLNDAQGSLRWFSKIMLQDEHDYNVLLSFADALEQTGNTTHAFKVRQYTLNQLRPLVLAQPDNRMNNLVRDYVTLLQQYGSTGENEVWTQRLLADAVDTSEEESAWRAEMAAAWYLSTQRNDYARLILTKMHEKRLDSPAWQQLALAIADENFNEIEEILASGASLSAGDRILALRKVGDEREAYELALDTMQNSHIDKERRVATDHVIAMQAYRPGYYAGGLNRKEINNLQITESGLSLRHTLADADLGFSIDYNRRQLARRNTILASDIENDLAVTAHFGNSLRGGSITAGINASENDELGYSGGELYLRDRIGRNELSTEVYINEITDTNETLRLAGVRDRAELAYSRTLGKNQYVRMRGTIDEIKTRTSEQRVSTGVGASVELGTSRSIGSNNWSIGVIASQNARQSDGIVSTTNDGSPLFTAYTGTFTGESQELALNATLYRGGTGSDYPQAASPRYHLSAWVGHNWPEESTAITLSAGAGFRVMGNDELSFSVSHDNSNDPLLDTNANSSVGVQYRNHF